MPISMIIIVETIIIKETMKAITIIMKNKTISS